MPAMPRSYDARQYHGDIMRHAFLTALATAASIAIALMLASPALAKPMLPGFHHKMLLGSSIPMNGDENPYAIAVVPATTGAIKKGDVLFDNFNARSNLQGTGSTIMQYDPGSRSVSRFARIPQNLKGCPGGVGLTTAMAVLESGWVIVGSYPGKDGTTRTAGAGCLIVLDAHGKVAKTLHGAHINGPWSNMAVRDEGSRATIFFTNIGFDLGPPGSQVQHKATVLRLRLATSGRHAPRVLGETVVGSGFPARASTDAFAIGPTGLVLAPDGTLYVSNALGNSIVAIAGALTRHASAGTGMLITRNGDFKRPLAMTRLGNGDLIVTNALNGKAVEVDPRRKRQVAVAWLDKDFATNPPGNGDLFGIAAMPDGKGLYFVRDDNNTLNEAVQ